MVMKADPSLTLLLYIGLQNLYTETQVFRSISTKQTQQHNHWVVLVEYALKKHGENTSISTFFFVSSLSIFLFTASVYHFLYFILFYFIFLKIVISF
jgi:hypothetical protein